MAVDRDLWVFAYGSLIWRPGFVAAERRIARLDGYARAFCMASIHYRGTPERPGLVLALDRRAGSACAGLAYRIPPETRADTLAYLRARELVSDAYHERMVPVSLEDGRRVAALAYVAARGHPQYRGALAIEEQARTIAAAAGPAGSNADYLLNTLASLDALGLADPDLARLAALVRARL